MNIDLLCPITGIKMSIEDGIMAKEVDVDTDGSDDELLGEELLGSPLECPSSPSPEDRNKCQACLNRLKQPMILNCLHVFCLGCLEKQVFLAR